MGSVVSRPSEWIFVEGTCHELGHTWNSSCVYCSLELLYFVYSEGFKIYLPLYLIGDLIKRRHPYEILTKTVPYILRSSLFLSINGGCFLTFICLVRRLVGGFYFLSTAFVPAFCSSLLGILVERKSRRGLLTGYVGAVAIESLYRQLKHRKIVSTLPHGEVLIFCFATAILISQLRSKKGSQDAISSILKLLLSPKVPRKLRQYYSLKHSISDTCLSIVDVSIRTALVSLWSFLLGYSVQVLSNAVQLGHRAVAKPDKVKQAITRRYNFKFGAFLASLTGLYMLVNALMMALHVPRSVRIVVAGMFAGLSMMFIKSTTISLYAATKAIEVLFFKAVKRGWLRSYYYADAILYSLFTATVFHTALFEVHNMRYSYLQFLNRVTRGRISQIDYRVVDRFGTDASWFYRMRRTQQRTDEHQD